MDVQDVDFQNIFTAFPAVFYNTKTKSGRRMTEGGIVELFFLGLQRDFLW